MGVLEICKDIGIELKRTREGKGAIESYISIIEGLDDTSKDLFAKLLPQIPWGIHFYNIAERVELFEINIDNPTLGEAVKKVLSHPSIKECSEQMSLLGNVIEEVSTSLFQNNVQYVLPEQIHATPQLYRSIQDLSVACQNTKILQNVMSKVKNDNNVLKIMEEFEDLRKNHSMPLYSKESRKIIKELVKKGYNKESVKTIYSFMALITIIKQTIYDSFMDRIYEIKESEDILSLRKRKIDDIELLEIELLPTPNVFNGQEKWIIRIEKNNGKIQYGQIFNKTINWGKEEIKIKQRAIIFLTL